MRATKLKELYPGSWNMIESGVMFDLQCMLNDKIMNHLLTPQVVAHNAAMLGCYEIHKQLKKEKKSIKEWVKLLQTKAASK